MTSVSCDIVYSFCPTNSKYVVTGKCESAQGLCKMPLTSDGGILSHILYNRQSD